MNIAERLRAEAGKRILVKDGAYGTQIQQRALREADYAGDLGLSREQKGNNDLLNLTRPELVREIAQSFADAGADILATNTFNANRISQADYGAESLVRDINAASARIMREVAGPDRWVAGAIGPANKTLSLSPNVNDPGYRAITFDEVVNAYAEQTRGLVDGGADIILVETVFDTLNAKAALVAIQKVFEEKKVKLPVMVSGTITDASGRTLSGQTVEAFLNSISHIDLLAVGLNCALGAKEMRPYLEELSHKAPFFVSCYPNAGLPNQFGEYDETPEHMSHDMHDFLESGFINIVG